MEATFDYLDSAVLDSIYDSARQVIGANICSITRDWVDRPGSFNIAGRWKERLCRIATSPYMWEKQNLPRQSISIFLTTWSLSTSFYLLFGTVCYYRNFDVSLKDSPRFRHAQIRAEIADSLLALFWLNTLTVPIFWAQVNSFSKIYKFGSVSGWYELAQFPLFVLFSDTCMYWLHRVFHTPTLFKMMHNKHQKYVIPTPFSAYAFHPLEAWIMSLPIHAYSFLWPMSDLALLIVFCWTNIWTFLLHDNRDQFHTVHHKNINFNFGQYLHTWDHLRGTYRDSMTFLKHGSKG